MMPWGVITRTVRATNALRTGNQNHPPENEGLARGVQRKRTDRPSPAEDRPAAPNTYSAPFPREPHDEAVPRGYAQPRQQWQPQQVPHPYSHIQGTHLPSQDYNHRYQDHDPRYNQFPSSQSGIFNQNMGPAPEPAYQAPDRQLQYPGHQDNNQPYHQDPGQYGSGSASHSGSNHGYAGQPYQEQLPPTNMNSGAYDQNRSDYGPTSYGQGQEYPHYSHSSYSDAQSFARGTAAPADYPHSRGVPPNSDYYDGENSNEWSHR